MAEETIETIERAWFLFNIPGVETAEGLRAIARSAWYEVDQQYAGDPTTFIVRADVVTGEVGSDNFELGFNIVAPASAPPGEDSARLRELFNAFHEALAAASCLSRSALEVGDIGAAIAMVQLHTPFPPHNNAPGYIPTSEQMSADGPLRDNRWG